MAVEPAEEISGGAIPFLGVAQQTAGDEVAIGIAAEGHAWDNVIEAANQRRKPTQAIETASAFSHMDGVAQSLGLEEVRLEVDAVRKGPGVAAADLLVAGGTNFVGQAHLDDMAGFAAFEQAQSAVGDETAHGPTGRVGGEANTAGEPGNGEAEAGPSFETAVADEMRIDGAVRDGQVQPGNEKVFEMFPDLCGVGFFVFHGQIQSGNFGKEVIVPTVNRQKKEQRFNAESTESGAQRSQRKKKEADSSGLKA